MRVALDKNGNRLYADNPERYMECFCPVCGEPLQHKIGKKYQPYFSHFKDSECAYGKDKDSKSEWHIRMQDYFPRESQEYRFVDKKTNEVHIADVFLKDHNMVLEFQHSPIDGDEFWKRTMFHIAEGRRVVWLFDESTKNPDQDSFGRFKKNERLGIGLYKDRSYKWLRNPRSFLNDNEEFIIKDKVYIYVYTGTEGDVFHRIVDYCNGFEGVSFSFHNIVMDKNMNAEEFLISEKQWQEEEPWKSVIAEIERKSQWPERIADRELSSIFELWRPFEYQLVVYNTEEDKCYLIYEDKNNKGEMMRSYYDSKSILYKYVTWDWDRNKIRDIYYKFYPLSDFKASKKIWLLVKGYGKHGINR